MDRVAGEGGKAMTEQEWLTAAADDDLLHRYWEHVSQTTGGPPKLNLRKLTLLSCARTRQVWDRIPHKCVRRSVEIQERVADGEEMTGAMLRLTGKSLSTLVSDWPLWKLVNHPPADLVR